MAMVTLQTETPTGAVAAPLEPATSAPGQAVLTADGEAAGAKGVQVTLRALKRIRAAMAKEGITPDAGGLRVGITGGGCSGLSYNIRFDTQPRERDRVYAFSQTHLDPEATEAPPIRIFVDPPIRIFVDPKSFIYLHGMILDYEETLMRQGFNFINPHSTKSCGCGSSFSA
ncbi:MAG: iron-sulfur cluster biosynthesis family protein [Acidobacteriaceae bacterium]|jgi:iron-sulfur cluster assembly protein